MDRIGYGYEDIIPIDLSLMMYEGPLVCVEKWKRAVRI